MNCLKLWQLATSGEVEALFIPMFSKMFGELRRGGETFVIAIAFCHTNTSMNSLNICPAFLVCFDIFVTLSVLVFLALLSFILHGFRFSDQYRRFWTRTRFTFIAVINHMLMPSYICDSAQMMLKKGLDLIKTRQKVCIAA